MPYITSPCLWSVVVSILHRSLCAIESDPKQFRCDLSPGKTRLVRLLCGEHFDDVLNVDPLRHDSQM